MLTVEQLGKNAQAAEQVLAGLSPDRKNEALEAIAKGIEAEKEAILAANGEDLARGKENGLSEALLDRLALTDARIEGICSGIRAVAALEDPVGVTLSRDVRPNGLVIEKVTVPMGVIAVIFEARPNVAADSSALCLKSGNAVILRGGKEAISSNKAIVAAMRRALESIGLPADCICLVEDTDRASARALMHLRGYVDLLIPRGGRGLIQAVVEEADVPVIETGAGTCHVYVHKDADLDMAADILFNAKVSRPSVCNACECLLADRAAAEAILLAVLPRLAQAGVQLRGDEEACRIFPGCVPADEEDFGKEYNDLILAVAVVDGVEGAIAHVARYGTKHSEAIVTRDAETAERFLNGVDAAAVYVNASTRFTDGGEFGLGAEIGISTQKMHARGPLGIKELTSYKYKVRGTGQVR